jgi:hypothetical protein
MTRQAAFDDDAPAPGLRAQDDADAVRRRLEIAF